MDPQDIRKQCVAVAAGRQPADLLLKNARVVNVFSGQIEETAIAIHMGRIAGTGPLLAVKEIDLKGRFVAPGFIDAHVHIESSMVSVHSFAQAVLPCGTTAVVADPHEIANVLGTDGIDFMMQASEDLPLRVYFGLPSCVPATLMETSGAHLEAHDLKPYMDHPRVVALGEVMNFPGVVAGDRPLLAKIQAARAHGLAVDGHAPGLSGRDLQAYVASGVGSDHECTQLAEAREKLALGMHIMVREGTGARNLDALVPLIDAETMHRMMWCTDDRHLEDILTEGHIDGLLRRVIAQGVDPVFAIRMATIVPARYFNLNDLGAVAVGKRADLVVFSDLSCPNIEQVYANGKIVAENGRVCTPFKLPQSTALPNVMNVSCNDLNFAVDAQSDRMHVIRLVDGQIITRRKIMDARIVDGRAEADPQRDLLKMAVVERYSGKGRTGIGFVQGMGLTNGALASSVAHDAHNLVVVGTNDEDMKQALTAVVEMGGGLALAADGRVRERLALPIAGLMSAGPVEEITAGLQSLTEGARQLGCPLTDPVMTLSFLALPVIPALKLTDHGLVDVDRFEVISLFTDENQR